MLALGQHKIPAHSWEYWTPQNPTVCLGMQALGYPKNPTVCLGLSKIPLCSWSSGHPKIPMYAWQCWYWDTPKSQPVPRSAETVTPQNPTVFLAMPTLGHPKIPPAVSVPGSAGPAGRCHRAVPAHLGPGWLIPRPPRHPGWGVEVTDGPTRQRPHHSGVAPLSRCSVPVPGSGGTGRGQGGDREVATASPAEPPLRGPLAFVLVLNVFPSVSGWEQSGEPGKCRQPLTPAAPAALPGLSQPCPDCRSAPATWQGHPRAPLPRVPECAVPYGAGDIQGGECPCSVPFSHPRGRIMGFW